MKTIKINSTGPLVELLQSTLKKLDFYNGNITGVFDKKTFISVANFQEQFGLQPDGIVGKRTWNALIPYINGYTNYTVLPNDTLYSISKYFDTTVDRILMANPKLSNTNNINIDDILIIPFTNIVPTDISYSSEILALNISSLKTVYPFLRISTIGYSVLGKELPLISLGNGSKKVFYSASIHANEWITTPLLMKFIEDFCLAYTENIEFNNYDTNSIFNTTTIYIAPMVNPDCVDIVTGAVSTDDPSYKKAELIAKNYPDIPFPDGWKANINGVDLNLQFPADWEQSKMIKYSQGFTSPAPRDFVGFNPLSEPEAVALYDFTLRNNFRLILAYHTQGEVIFWKFKDFLPPDSLEIGEAFSKVSGYALLDTPYNSSFAGYKDWFIQEYNKPGYTVEAGLGENPLPISQFDKIYSDNIGILILGTIL